MEDQTFAIIVPITKAASDMLKFQDNQATRQTTCCFNHLFDDVTGKARLLGKLDLMFSIGRRYMPFGTARSASFVLPPESGVSRWHFLLHFDFDHRELVLTDTSQSGTWITDQHQPGCRERRLFNESQVLRNKTRIRISNRLIFDIVLTDGMRSLRNDKTPAWFNKYQMSLVDRRPSVAALVEAARTIVREAVDVEARDNSVEDAKKAPGTNMLGLLLAKKLAEAVQKTPRDVKSAEGGRKVVTEGGWAASKTGQPGFESGTICPSLDWNAEEENCWNFQNRMSRQQEVKRKRSTVERVDEAVPRKRQALLCR